MKIIIASDLHYQEDNYDRVEEFIQSINETGAETLFILGDIASGVILTSKCLQLFRDFKLGKYFIAGNHDIWSKNFNSLEIYNGFLPNIGKKFDFKFLEGQPIIINGIGFVGTIGWYDYSFRDKDWDIPFEYYLNKSIPDVTTWVDKLMVNWDLIDGDFTNQTIKNLEEDIKMVYEKSQRMVCLCHHVPFFELLPDENNEISRFYRAFSGSEKIGKLINKYPKIKYVFCGHTHRYKKFVTNQFTAINIGSRRSKPRFELLEL